MGPGSIALRSVGEVDFHDISSPVAEASISFVLHPDQFVVRTLEGPDDSVLTMP